MKIKLPKSNMPLIRLEVMCPDESFQMTFSDIYTEAVFDIPDDVPEDAVEVIATWLDAGNKPVGDVIVLKEAIVSESEDEPEDEPEDEDENDEEAPGEVDESLPDEMVDEEADKEEVEEVDEEDAVDSRYGRRYS